MFSELLVTDHTLTCWMNASSDSRSRRLPTAAPSWSLLPGPVSACSLETAWVVVVGPLCTALVSLVLESYIGGDNGANSASIDHYQSYKTKETTVFNNRFTYASTTSTCCTTYSVCSRDGLGAKQWYFAPTR